MWQKLILQILLQYYIRTSFTLYWIFWVCLRIFCHNVHLLLCQFPQQPPLSDARLEMIDAAFTKFDRSGDGRVTVEDLRGVYSAEFHPKFQSGEWTEDQVLQNWLDQFTSDDGNFTVRIHGELYSGAPLYKNFSVRREEI